MALGIPSLVADLQREAAAQKLARHPLRPPRRQQHSEGQGPPSPPPPPTRRSARLQDAAEHPHPKPETAEESFDRELGEFAVEGACPRCGRVLERGQRAHLQRCGGEKAALRQPRWRDDEELAELSEEERQDVHKRTLTRMKHVQLEGLMDLSPEAARFFVLGSTGKHYIVRLSNDAHSCSCPDYRFRRHHCKHICLVLQQLGLLEATEQQQQGWRRAVEARLDQLVQLQHQQGGGAEAGAADDED